MQALAHEEGDISAPVFPTGSGRYMQEPKCRVEGSSEQAGVQHSSAQR